MAYWCGVAFGFGVALFFTGLGAIPTERDTLPWLEWGGALVALGACIVAYTLRKRARAGVRAQAAAG